MKIAKMDRSSSPPLASNTKKREGKIRSSLRLFFNLVVIVITFGIEVPSPWVFHSSRRKRRVDDWLGGLKTHRSVPLALVLQ
jgi:hypothetical protein